MAAKHKGKRPHELRREEESRREQNRNVAVDQNGDGRAESGKGTRREDERRRLAEQER